MNGNPSTSASTPTIGVDIFKELINAMENKINQNINQNLVNVTATMDKIATRIQQQDSKINNLEQKLNRWRSTSHTQMWQNYHLNHYHNLIPTLTLKITLTPTQTKQLQNRKMITSQLKKSWTDQRK